MNGNDLVPEITLPKSMLTLFDQMKEPYGIKDFESRYVYANKAVLALYGVKKMSEIVGKTEMEINSKLVEYNDAGKEFTRQDKIVFSTDQSLNSLEIHPEAVDYPYIANKVPFRDINNKCIGVLAYAKKLEVYSLNDYVKGNMPGSLLLNKPDDFFTERQCEIMFYRLQGLKVKEVAKRLNLTENTINNYMQTLYDMANVNNLSEFKEFCEMREYHRYLPKRFLSNQHIDFGSSII
ncbi:LuxR C-terminal-related transcriptional regulator [Acerihabitans sp. TG2]|uniref:LuxR C-terminal-related transcriptional regulator n=1 Tax=Acerihabitans sp. TG2 TaxID=3096008 RepID=UPI002B228D1A|nr:LuxR C-terminal-related transcriptional regulator [Acerihabitans sp. TG2]MEA9389090.1 LuxR C-terminal-related transcriptional regulator [Acerihabitans sp. TG2]